MKVLYQVYLDGGVTTGTDVFKALAMGAEMVFVGRPALWGLAWNGQEGRNRYYAIVLSNTNFLKE